MEFDIVLTCTYCGVTKEFRVPLSDIQWAMSDKQEHVRLPSGWSHGHFYMSDRKTIACEVCSKTTHY